MQDTIPINYNITVMENMNISSCIVHLENIMGTGDIGGGSNNSDMFWLMLAGHGGHFALYSY